MARDDINQPPTVDAPAAEVAPNDPLANLSPAVREALRLTAVGGAASLTPEQLRGANNQLIAGQSASEFNQPGLQGNIGIGAGSSASIEEATTGAPPPTPNNAPSGRGGVAI